MNLGENIFTIDKKHMFQKLGYFEKFESRIKYPCIVKPKIDGVFCCAVKDIYGNVHILSRTGEEYISMPHIIRSIETLGLLDEPHVQFMLFEAYLTGELQSKASGYARDTIHFHEEIKASYWGWVDTKEVLHLTDKPFYDSNIVLCPCIEVSNREELDAIYQRLIDIGEEGIVIYTGMSQPYQRGKRNASIIKRKQGVSYDLLVVDIKEGTGKYKGMVGAMICRWEGNRLIKVSGMTDAQRQEWWKTPSSIIGQIVQIDAMTLSSSGILREPRFKGIRHDKEAADY